MLDAFVNMWDPDQIRHMPKLWQTYIYLDPKFHVTIRHRDCPVISFYRSNHKPLATIELVSLSLDGLSEPERTAETLQALLWMLYHENNPGGCLLLSEAQARDIKSVSKHKQSCIAKMIKRCWLEVVIKE